MAERVRGISTHVLDSSRGAPAQGIPVTLEIKRGAQWALISQNITDPDGRCSDLLGDIPLTASTYRITFDTVHFFDSPFLYPEVAITFVVREADNHYHIPLLLGPNTYTTYRGT